MKATGKKYAVKLIQKKFIMEKKNKDIVFRERQILNALKHPLVVTLHYTFQTQTDLCTLSTVASPLFLLVGGVIDAVILFGQTSSWTTARMERCTITSVRYHAALLRIGALRKSALDLNACDGVFCSWGRSTRSAPGGTLPKSSPLWSISTDAA